MLVVFDNDKTLYDDRAAHAEFKRILADYVAGRRGCTAAEAAEFVEALKSGSEVRSSSFVLSRAFGLDPEEIIAQTYLRIDLDRCVAREDPVRHAVLRGIQEPKVVLTNGPSQYTRKVLRHVGLEMFFEKVFGELEVDFRLKPDRGAFEAVMRRYPGEDKIVFVDNSAEYLDAARSLGWRTIWLDTQTEEPPAPERGHLIAGSFGAIAPAIALV